MFWLTNQTAQYNAKTMQNLLISMINTVVRYFYCLKNSWLSGKRLQNVVYGRWNYYFQSCKSWALSGTGVIAPVSWKALTCTISNPKFKMVFGAMFINYPLSFHSANFNPTLVLFLTPFLFSNTPAWESLDYFSSFWAKSGDALLYWSPLL